MYEVLIMLSCTWMTCIILYTILLILVYHIVYIMSIPCFGFLTSILRCLEVFTLEGIMNRLSKQYVIMFRLYRSLVIARHVFDYLFLIATGMFQFCYIPPSLVIVKYFHLLKKYRINNHQN